MAYNEDLAARIREQLALTQKNVEEKRMFGGLCFMVNGKMCMGLAKERLMLRLDPAIYEEVLEKEGCAEMDFTGKPMKGYVFVEEDAVKTGKQLAYWVGLALDYNKQAKATKKR